MLQAQEPLASCCVTGEQNPNVEKRNEQIMDSAPLSVPSTDYQPVEVNKDNLISVNKTHAPATTSTDAPNERARYNCAGPNNSLLESSDANASWLRKGAGDGTIMRHLGDAVLILPLVCYLN